MPRLFLYGTLKRGHSNHEQMEGQVLEGQARTGPGWRLFRLDGYPGMVRWPDDRDGVVGEVWRVSDVALAALDAFEGVHEGLYRRESISVSPLSPGEPVQTYVFAGSVEGRESLGSVWQG